MCVNFQIKDISSINDPLFTSIKELIEKSKKGTSFKFLISGNKLISQTRITRFAEEKQFTCNKDMLDKIIENASLAFGKEAATKHAELISQHTLSLSLNGYEVSAPKNQKVNEVKLNIAFAALDMSFKSALLAQLGLNDVKEVMFESLPYAQTQSLCDLKNEKEFILASVYGHSLDLSVRKGQSFFETSTSLIGTIDIIKHISTGMNISEEEALSSLSKYNESKLDPAMLTVFEQSLQSFSISLDNEVKKVFGQLSKGILLPSKVFLEVDPTFAKVYEHAFRNDTYHSLSFSEKGFEVNLIESIIIP